MITTEYEHTQKIKVNTIPSKALAKASKEQRWKAI